MIIANHVSENANLPNSKSRPHINVTPLIDVLLVVLIIFLVLTPLKPARFLTRSGRTIR